MPVVVLHKNARTTHAIRKEIKESPLSYRQIAEAYKVSLDTVVKWKKRESVEDKSHRRDNINSSLNETEEEIVKELREKVGLSINDITEVMNRCINPKLSRSAIYRTVKRIGALKGLSFISEETEEIETKKFETVDEYGHIHMDVKYLTKLDNKRSYLYVAIDRLTRYVYAEILYNMEPSTASGFVHNFITHFPYTIKKIVTDNGFEWTDRCSGGVKEKATGNHPVDIVCNQNNIKHRLTRIRRPQTNGMVERFNRRVNEHIYRKGKISTNSGRNSFHSHEDRNLYIKNFIDSYNRTRLWCLKYRAPIEVLLPDNHTELYTFTGMTKFGSDNLVS